MYEDEFSILRLDISRSEDPSFAEHIVSRFCQQVNAINLKTELCQLKKSVVSTDRIIGNSVRHHNNPCDYRSRYLNNLTLHYH